MKKTFEELLIEVLVTSEDVIKTSGEQDFQELWVPEGERII